MSDPILESAMHLQVHLLRNAAARDIKLKMDLIAPIVHQFLVRTDACNFLSERVDSLHHALRRVVIKPSSDVATHCSLCKGSWAFNRPDGEWHEPGCLAAPKEVK